MIDDYDSVMGVDSDDELPKPYNTIDGLTDYKKIEFDEIDSKLRKRAEKFIKGVTNLYLKAYENVNDDYIKALSRVETDNLVVMLKQVKYAEHVLDTLMKRYNMGGYVDSAIYVEIRQMQEHVMKILVDVSKYTRGIPDYFKFTESEFDLVAKLNKVNDINLGTRTIEVGVSSQAKQIGQTENAYDLNDIMSTNRGTASLIKKIEALETNSIEEVNKKLNETPDVILDFDPSDINVDDDDDEEFSDFDDDDDGDIYNTDEEE